LVDGLKIEPIEIDFPRLLRKKPARRRRLGSSPSPRQFFERRLSNAQRISHSIPTSENPKRGGALRKLSSTAEESFSTQSVKNWFAPKADVERIRPAAFLRALRGHPQPKAT
jgi:hypothetical protein